MLSLEDCLDFSDLANDEIEAIAAHEHIPLICAAELGCELLKTPDGIRQLHSMVLDDMEQALEHGQMETASRWALVYRQLQNTHPISPSSR
ncbi:MAG: hypothetical protein C0489_03760 [Candidatus Accumulibacter sp.]|nr:hypothetical protein [Accumulibacter sp.]MBA4093184.1 hypothetical protein [Accumulibacter sp.]